MKKLLVTILALVYLTSSIGTTVHMHYCMNKLVAWSIGYKNSNKDSCSNCGMSKSAKYKNCSTECKGCCKDDQKQLKLDDDQKHSEAFFKFEKNPTQTISIFADYSFKYVSFYREEDPLIHAPPLIRLQPLFVLNCVYRI